MRCVCALLAGVVVAIAGCGPGSPSTSSSEPTTNPTPSSVVGPTLVPASPPATDPPPSGAACSLNLPAAEPLPLPVTSGRCRVAGWEPALSFEASPGWLWAGDAITWHLAVDRPPPTTVATYLSFYRYGGAVVPFYCTDPPAVVPMTKGSKIVAWLETVEGLDVEVTGRSIGVDPVFQLDLAVDGAPGCSPGKAGLVSLWTVDGQPEYMNEYVAEDEAARVYMIERPSGIVFMTARWQGLADPTSFLLDADQVFSSLAFE